MRIDLPIEMEEDMARIHAGYSYPAYHALPGDPFWCNEQFPDSKAVVLARFRAYQFIEAVKQDASIPEPKKGKGRR